MRERDRVYLTLCIVNTHRRKQRRLQRRVRARRIRVGEKSTCIFTVFFLFFSQTARDLRRVAVDSVCLEHTHSVPLTRVPRMSAGDGECSAGGFFPVFARVSFQDHFFPPPLFSGHINRLVRSTRSSLACI